MKRLFEFILFVCFHEWEIIKKVDLSSKIKYASGGTHTKDGYGYVLKCKKCGELKSKDFWV